MAFTKTKTNEERFRASFVVRPSGCWEWAKHRLRSGHGTFSIGSRTNGSRRMVKAHRFAWELSNGPIPDGGFVLHKCFNACCVNPDHLKIGDTRENADDRVRAGRSGKGESNPNAKLTAEEVAEIRRLYRPRKVTQAQLAKKFNVSQVMISKIVRGESWGGG